MRPVLAVFLSQVFFTAADSLQKHILKGEGFSAATLLDWKFLLTLPVAGVGFVFLMYGLSQMDVSKTIILLSVFGVLLAAAAGVLFFQDRITWYNMVGIGLAVVAIVLVRMP